MVVNFLFPFNDALLQNYQKKEVAAENKKTLWKGHIIFILVSLLVIFWGTSSHLRKAIYFSPVIFESFCSIILLFSQSEKKNYLVNTLTPLSISHFAMAVCILISRWGETLADSVKVMLVSELVFLILLVVGYRIHLSYQLKHVCPNKKSNWNSVLSLAIALIGVKFAKLLSRELVVFLCWLLWIAVHLGLSAAVLEHRKYTRFLSINENVMQGNDKEKAESSATTKEE